VDALLAETRAALDDIGERFELHTVFVGGVVLPTLAAFLKPRLKITSSAAFYAVVVGGGSALLAKIHNGAPLKALLPQPMEGWLVNVLGPHYLSLLPIVLCLLVMLGVSYLVPNPKRSFSS